MEKISMIAQFLLGLSIIVGLHELGHLLFAKLFGMRVEYYIIGFPPKLFKFQWGETEYALGAVPFGGAVKISGMIDESLDNQSLKKTPEPWEFRAKPAWQRLIVMLGGILFNIISGSIIYIILTFAAGETYLAKDTINQHGIVPNAIGYKLGFQEGDKIISINGKDFKKFTDILSPRTLLSKKGYYTVLRGEQELRIDIPPSLLDTISEHKHLGPFVAPRMPFKVKAVLDNSGAAQAGLQPNDEIVSVAGLATPYFHQLQQALAANAHKEVTLAFLRQGELHQTQAMIDAQGKLGFAVQPLLQAVQQRYGFGEAVIVGSGKALGVIRNNAIALSKIFTGQLSASKSISGPIGIVKIFRPQFSWVGFWSIVALLSMVLALTNLLPIPALDGGHVLFLLYEIVTGYRLSDKFLENAQKVGMTILICLLGYTVINDLYKMFH